MHLEFLIEELSAEAALTNLVPKIVGTEMTFTIHVFQGKMDLLKQLPDRNRSKSFRVFRDGLRLFGPTG